VKAVKPPFEVRTRERSLSGPVDDPELVERTALDLLDDLTGDPIRKVGVRVSNLAFTDRDQSHLATWDDSVDGGGSSADSGRTGTLTGTTPPSGPDSVASAHVTRPDRLGQTTLFQFLGPESESGANR